VTFEDKPLLSDIVFLRAWVAVDVPKLYNTMTNLLAPTVKPINATAITRKGSARAHNAEGDGGDQAAAAAAPPPTQQQQQQVAAAAAAGEVFIAAMQFSGARPGYVFKKGPKGVGYYTDAGPFKGSILAAGAAAATAAAAAAAELPGPPADSDPLAGVTAGGWVGMRTVAELRRAAGVGAPRETDSLYKPVERAPRVFNPLKVPAKLQAALPFKTKPKVVSGGGGWGGGC
jgi:ribosome biogenesis protein BMS1